MQHDVRSDTAPADDAARPYPFATDRLFLTCGVAAALLYWVAFADHTGGLVTLVTMYICGLSLVWAVIFYAAGHRGWAVAAVCSAILFNPLLVSVIDQDSRRVVTFAGGCLFAWTALQRYVAVTGKTWVAFAPSVLAFVVLSVVQLVLNPSDSSDDSDLVENVTAEQMVGETPRFLDPVRVDVDRAGQGGAAVDPPNRGSSAEPLGTAGGLGALDPDQDGLTVPPGGLDTDSSALPVVGDPLIGDATVPDPADQPKPPPVATPN